MRTANFRSVAVTTLLLAGTGLFAGCASLNEPVNGEMSQADYQYLYPRQHLDSLPAHEREAEERSWRQENSRQQGTSYGTPSYAPLY